MFILKKYYIQNFNIKIYIIINYKNLQFILNYSFIYYYTIFINFNIIIEFEFIKFIIIF